MAGYIRHYRSLYDHWLWKEKRTFSKFEAWSDLLQRAAFAPYRQMIGGKLIDLQVGDQVASIRFLASRWGWGKSKVECFVRLLEEQSMIARNYGQGETVVSVCNYATYNDNLESVSDSRRTVTGQSPDSDRTKDKKNKKNKKDKKEISDLSDPPPKPETEPTKPTKPEEPYAVIQPLWDAYPKRGRARSTRRKCLVAWKAITPKPELEQVVAALRVWSASPDWSKDGGEFVPAADRWMKNRGWEDLPTTDNQDRFGGMRLL